MPPLHATLQANAETIQALRIQVQAHEYLLHQLLAGSYKLYTSPQPSRQPPTDYQVEQLAHRTCWRYFHDRSDKADHIYTFDRNTMLNFARALHEGQA